MIELFSVSHNYSTKQGNVDAVVDFNLSIPAGEVIALLGPSGCGKSTLLRLMAGFMEPTRGKIRVKETPPGIQLRERTFGLMFQEAALLPWRTALENVELPGEISGETTRSPKELLQSVGLEEYQSHYPHQLSGGQQQRIALARTLVMNHPILLLDEPFSRLDDITRGDLQDLLDILLRERQTTVVLVTHSLTEAVYLCDRIVVLSQRPGRIKGIVTVSLPRPRERRIKSKQEFYEVLKCVEELVWVSSVKGQ